LQHSWRIRHAQARFHHQRPFPQIWRHHRQSHAPTGHHHQRNKPRFVPLNVEDYERLREYADHRQAYKLETMPDDLFEEMKKAVATDRTR